jgi:hypothetical protein
VEKGEILKTLRRKINSQGHSDDDYSRLVRMLCARGYLRLPITSNYGKSRKGPMVCLKDQRFKDNWPVNREKLLADLRKPIWKTKASLGSTTVGV